MNSGPEPVGSSPPPGWNEQIWRYQQELQHVRDDEHLKLLVIGYWIVGVMTVLYSSFFIMYIVMGSVFLNHPGMMNTPPRQGGPPVPASDPFPAPFGYFMIIMGVAVVSIGWTIGGLNMAAARFIQQRRRYVFIQVMAGLQCLQVPFGTLVGVSTLIVLSRPSVRAVFDLDGADPPAPWTNLPPLA